MQVQDEGQQLAEEAAALLPVEEQARHAHPLLLPQRQPSGPVLGSAPASLPLHEVL